MSKKVIFQDNMCSVIEENVLFKCTPSDMLIQMQNSLPFKSGFMASNMVYYERSIADKSVYVIEKQPSLLRVKYHARKVAGSKQETYYLSLPYIYFVIRFEGRNVTTVYPCCSKEPIRDLGQEIYILPLPNVNSGGSGSFCLGSNSAEISWPENKKIDHIVGGILTTTWNDDLTVKPLKEFGVDSFKDWCDKSLKNPIFWNELKYIPHHQKTIEGLIKLCLS